MIVRLQMFGQFCAGVAQMTSKFRVTIVQAPMRLHRGTIMKCTFTHRALVRFLTVMNTHMNAQTFFRPIRIGTQQTFVRLLTGMRTHMALQRFGKFKWFSTQFTLVRTNRNMRTIMKIQMSFKVKRSRTLAALEWSQIYVRLHVTWYVITRPEFILTNITFEQLVGNIRMECVQMFV